MYVILFLVCILILFLYVIVRKQSLSSGSSILISHSTLETFDMLLINGNQYSSFVDGHDNPLVLGPHDHLVVPLHDQMELIAYDISQSSWEGNHGLVILSLENLSHISYWGSSKQSDWKISSSNLVPSIMHTVHDSNPVFYSSVQKHSDRMAITNHSTIPRYLMVVNQNQSTVHFHIYSTVSALTSSHYYIASQSSISITLPLLHPDDDIVVIAQNIEGGIQGTIVVIDKKRTCRLFYLFGQQPYPSPQSIGIYGS